MTIDEAIGILTTMGTPQFRGSTEQILQARKLGIKALKREQILRREVPYDRNGLLPGETPEERGE